MKLELLKRAAVLGLLVPAQAMALTMSFVSIGDPGNVSDPANSGSVPGIGTVGSIFAMGAFEVTNSQYAEFLNSVDLNGTNPLGLFSSSMTTDARGGLLLNPGAPAGSKFSIKTGYESMPVVHVSFFDAVRFTNWLHNGQGAGDTESGAYTLLGGTETPSNANLLSRNPGAQFWVPSENEWYKAAYFQPMAQGGDADHYWLYPMRTNLTPFSSHPSGTTPDNSRAGNIFGFDSLPNGYDDGFAVTGSPSFDAAQNYLTNVGAYTQSRSYFGAFDLGGNVMEWNETMDASFFRGVRGGSWSLLAADLRSSSRSFLDASGAGNVVGFRVATVPEPTVAGIALLGALGLAARRPRRRR